ncbi:MAG: hypothetical protein JSS02_28750 [Planctomycetes bacterium]|nr:hypothetical protein [Planctomycetota bacterium]
MNMWQVDFHELYRRHLCRHSAWGLNFYHFVAVLGVYTSLFGLALQSAFQPIGQGFVAAVLAAYFMTLACNVPAKVFMVTLLVVFAVLAAVLFVPGFLGRRDILPAWGHLLLLVTWHRCQVFQHRFYPDTADMSAFEARYKKGFALFVLLAVYELPLLLNFLVYDHEQPAEIRRG